MSTINTTTAVVAALRAAASFQARVSEVRESLPARVIADRDALAAALRPGVAKFYGIDFDASYGKSGKFVTDDEQLGMAARTALSKLARAVQGVSVAHTSEPTKLRVKANERAAYDAFLAACGGDAKRLAAVVKALKA